MCEDRKLFFFRELYVNAMTSLPANVFSSLGLCTSLFVDLQSRWLIQGFHGNRLNDITPNNVANYVEINFIWYVVFIFRRQ